MHDSVVITGAFSYTGRYTTRILLERGYRVRTLTNHPPAQNPEQPDPFAGQVEVFPYNFDRPAELRRSLEGALTLINTYWIRFPRGETTFTNAVGNSRTLIETARDAGIRRIVHVSIANPSLDSPLGYYHGKALVEQAVVDSGLSYAILRPTVIFGTEDILINNIAWFVRRFPVFAIPGDGCYQIRPIYVEDMAQLLADATERQENTIVDAVGPETLSFEKVVRLVARSLDRDVRLIHVPRSIAYVSTLLTGWLVGDVVLTWQEYEGLMSNLLKSEAATAGPTRLSEWLAENGDCLGRRYTSEVARHYASVSKTKQRRTQRERVNSTARSPFVSSKIVRRSSGVPSTRKGGRGNPDRIERRGYRL
jgi:NADH dehydrogenase